MKFRAAALLLVIGVGLSFSGAPDADAAVTDPPKLLGLATNDWVDDFDAFQDDVGKPPAIQQFFVNVDDVWPKPWIPGRLSTLHAGGSIAYFEIMTKDYAALVGGSLDADFDAMIDQLADWLAEDPNRGMLIAPFPEANLEHHEWGGDPSGYKDFFQRVRTAFDDRGVGDQIKMVFAMNGLSSTGFSYAEFYPGDELADIIGFAKLNNGGSSWRDYDEAFQRHIDEMQQEVSIVKPILITQTGSVDPANGDRDEWLTDMFTGLGGNDQVIGAVYFSRDKTDTNGKDYRIVVNGVVDSIVVDLYPDWSEPSETSWLFDGSLEAWVDGRVEELVFLDTVDSIFLDEILWLEEQGITGGCAQYYFCPQERVTRAQMASFLARALDLAPSGEDYFDDDDGDPHEDNINALADVGITAGCVGERTYCPDEFITRAQMATFLVRALGLPSGDSDWFTDDDNDPHEPNINAMAENGITLGCGEAIFCPGDPVIREHMAAFLFRALSS